MIAGGCAGITELLIMYPLDVIKTRYQATAASQTSSLFHTMRVAIVTEKMSIYRGILFPILTEAPKRAVKFTSYGIFSGHLQLNMNRGSLGFCAGCLTGMTEGLLVAAPELIKIRMQIPANKHLYSSSWHAAAVIQQTEGLRGLFRGSFTSMCRNGSWNTAYFGTIPFLRQQVGQKTIPSEFFCGTVAGTLGTVFNTPFDVIKTRIQNGHTGSMLGIGLTIVRNEGWQALWKGFVPKVLRLGPGGGIMLFVYDQVSRLLNKSG